MSELELLRWIQFAALSAEVPTKQLEDELFKWAEMPEHMLNLNLPNANNPVGLQLLVLCYAFGSGTVRETAKRIKPFILAGRKSEQDSYRYTSRTL